LPLNSGIQTNQILSNDDEVCIPHLSSILLALHREFPKAESGKSFVPSATSKDIHTVIAFWKVINVPKDYHSLLQVGCIFGYV
jgi:hypothetical protein